MKAPIRTVKHLVQMPFDQIATGTRQNNTLVFAVPKLSVNLSTEVEEGAIVKAIYVELWTQNSANDGHEVVVLEKTNNNLAGPTFAEMAALFSYENKKNILFTHEGLTSNDGVGNPIAVLRQWIKIPKSKQRFGLGDGIALTLSNPSSNNLNRCGFAVYKEYT